MRQIETAGNRPAAPAAAAGAAPIESRLRLSGDWLSVFEISLAPEAESETALAREPLVLRVDSGRLRLWRIARSRRSEIEAGPGTILRIAAGERFGYANAENDPLHLTITAATDTAFAPAGRAYKGLAA